jgi:integrase
MVIRMVGIVKRGGQYIYRRRVPRRLRSVIGAREVKRSLGTSDLSMAQKKWQAVHADVDRLFAEAEKAIRNPSVAAYKAVERWKQQAAIQPLTDGHEEGFDYYLTTALEQDEDGSRPLDAIQRATLQALLKRSSPESAKDNPPLSLVFDRYKAERRPSAKTWREFDRALRGFVDTVGDLPVRAIQKEHVRAYKQALLNGISKRDGKSPVKVATVQKLLNVLRAVLEWANREGIVESNVAHGVSRVAALASKADTADERRMPFTVEQVRTIIQKLPAEGPIRWLYLMGLYSGARLSELVGLRREDVRTVDDVLCVDIKPHAGRSLKNKSSRRLVPVHPELLAAGFKADLLPFKGTGHYHSRRVNEWLRKVAKIADPAVSFHSARHLVKDRLRAARVPEAEQRALMGHSSNSVADGYGVGFPVSVLLDAISKVRY